MWRLALLLWVIGGTVLAGILVTVVLLVPAWSGALAIKYIPIAALIGALVAIPISVGAAKAISARTAGA